MTCGCCNYAYYGKPVSRSSAKGKVRYAYYRCVGTDAYRFGGQRVCQNKQVRTDMLDEAVWRDVQELLRDPQLLRAEYERRLEAPSEDVTRERSLRQQAQSAQRTVSRLIDAFTDGLLDKSEFEPRLAKARERVARVEEELAKLSAREEEQAELRAALACLNEFKSRMGQGLEQADWTTRREIIRLLVERVCIEPEQIRIVYRISFPLFLQTLQCPPDTTSQTRISQYRWRRDLTPPFEHLPALVRESLLRSARTGSLGGCADDPLCR
ncbi:MAG: recombinase zinc beta ribbon domain-containing protein [Planctomycetaceae bacterium]|nr:recombinase zinc beta ribbon domain-containing protein [Planctomycetaceae bacterium]